MANAEPDLIKLLCGKASGSETPILWFGVLPSEAESICLDKANATCLA